MGCVIDCKRISQERRNALSERLRKTKITPGLAVIIVGEDAASQVYVRNKMKACQSLGFISETYQMDADSKTEDVVKKIEQLARNEYIHGILVQLPLPAHIDAKRVIEAIPPKKDVDAITPTNMGRLVLGTYDIAPCTPSGIMHILADTCGSVSGANCVVIGRSDIVGKPMSILLTHNNATVTLCHSRTEGLKEIASKADILISSVGKAGFVTADMVRKDAIVIDVGINRGTDGKLVGDICYEEVLKKASAVTPVPGGVGVMTITALLENTYKAALLAAKGRIIL